MGPVQWSFEHRITSIRAVDRRSPSSTPVMPRRRLLRNKVAKMMNTEDPPSNGRASAAQTAARQRRRWSSSCTPSHTAPLLLGGAVTSQNVGLWWSKIGSSGAVLNAMFAYGSEALARRAAQIESRLIVLSTRDLSEFVESQVQTYHLVLYWVVESRMRWTCVWKLSHWNKINK